MTDRHPMADGLGRIGRYASRRARQIWNRHTTIERIEVVLCRGPELETADQTRQAWRPACRLPTVTSIERAHAHCLTQGLDLALSTVVDVEADSDVGIGVTVGRRALRLYVVDGVELAEHALTRLVELFDQHRDLDLAYSDAAGPAPDSVPLLLPGFSPERLVDQMYLGQMLAIRGGAERRLSRATTARDGIDQWDRAWQLAKAARRVAHLPERLYVVSLIPESPLMGTRESGVLAAGMEIDEAPLVSIIVPTCGGRRQLDRGETVLVELALQSVFDRSSYPNYEVVVVTTPGTPDDLPARLRELVSSPGNRLSVVHDSRPFNFSNACNFGALHSEGQLVLFLNDDTEVITGDWIEQLTRHAVQPDVGAVGAKLLFEGGTVQHNGIWSRGGHPVHRYESSEDGAGYLNALDVAQNCLAVTGACLAVERSKFMAAGGFSPIFPNSYNDVDLCLKLLDLGWRTVIEPRARLYHYEASTRDPSIEDDDMIQLHDRWRWRLNHDPFDNPSHDAPLSDELPLPGEAGHLSSPDESPIPRLWPLEPMVAAPSDLAHLIPERDLGQLAGGGRHRNRGVGHLSL